MATIGIIGDFQADNPTHVATVHALRSHDSHWIGTDTVGVGHNLGRYHGLVIAPGSPYRDLNGALRAITYARTEGVPVLGTCAGFQHIIIEFARSVLGIDANHAEYDPDADQMFVTPLSCSLVGQELAVQVEPDSVAGRAYGESLVDGWASERYHCNFGLNSDHEAELQAAGLTISGRDADGEARIVELLGHPFFVGTLFVPQAGPADHALVQVFLAAANTRQELAAHSL